MTGLAELRGDVVPRSRLVPIGDVLLASDGFTRDADDPPDYVASYTPTARTCDVLTVRKRGRRALDVGTGSGIHALLAARRPPRGRRGRRQSARARVHGAERRAERLRQRRVPRRELLRAGRGRDVRPDHVQRAVRRLAGTAVGVSRQRPARRRPDRAARRRDRGAPRRRRLRDAARQLARHPRRRPGGASGRVGGGDGLRRLGARVAGDGPARSRRIVERAVLRRSGRLRGRARRVDGVSRRARRARGRRGRDPPPPPRRGPSDRARRRDRRGRARARGQADPASVRESRAARRHALLRPGRGAARARDAAPDRTRHRPTRRRAGARRRHELRASRRLPSASAWSRR